MHRTSSREKQPKRVVIAGAGPGGLATAMLLARSGVHVTVVEKHSRVGGRTAPLDQDGFKFDIGPTFFLYPRMLREIFADASYDLDREVPMKRLGVHVPTTSICDTEHNVPAATPSLCGTGKGAGSRTGCWNVGAAAYDAG